MTKIDKNNLKRIYNYGLRSIAAFCSARKDLKMLCLKVASEPLFLILAGFANTPNLAYFMPKLFK